MFTLENKLNGTCTFCASCVCVCAGRRAHAAADRRGDVGRRRRPEAGSARRARRALRVPPTADASARQPGMISYPEHVMVVFVALRAIILTVVKPSLLGGEAHTMNPR